MQFDLKDFRMDLEVTRIANAHYFEFTSNYHSVPNSHPFCELVYVDSGEIDLKAKNYKGKLSAGQMIIHEPNESHELTCNSNIAPDVIIIGFECKATHLKYFSNNPVILTVPFQRMLAEVIKECRNLFWPPYDKPLVFDMKKRENRIFGCDQMVKILLEQFLIKLVRSIKYGENNPDQPHQINDSVVSEICEYLKTNYKQDLNIKKLCTLFGTNKTTLSSRFKNHTGQTIVEYVNKLKLNEAKRLIRRGEKTLSQISEELNFSSQHYFSKWFKKHEQHAPSEYARMIKAKLE